MLYFTKSRHLEMQQELYPSCSVVLLLLLPFWQLFVDFECELGILQKRREIL